jgi:hypothetical protein
MVSAAWRENLPRSSATSAVRGNPEHIAPIIARVMAGILAKQRRSEL